MRRRRGWRVRYFCSSIQQANRTTHSNATQTQKPFSRMTFHNLRNTATELKAVVDIDILDTLTVDEIQFAELMFHRRQIYEHNGGVADEKYLADSGDSTVRRGQVVHQSRRRSAHRIISLIAKMGQALHQDFTKFPPRKPGPSTSKRGAKR